MPSDDRMGAVLALLEPPLAALRGSIASAMEEVKAYLALQGLGGRDRLDRVRAQLGAFALGRVDADRFAALFGDNGAADRGQLDLIKKGLATLTDLAGRPRELVARRVPSGGSLAAAVDGALAEIGRVFAAARAVEHARTGRGKALENERLLEAFPYRMWSKAERRLAPPLVIEVDGADCDAGALAAFLDGAQKIVLVVAGPSTPAPLARVITPSTFVMQADDPAALTALLRYDGPGVAALVESGAACFTHDPSAGARPWERLTIARMPDPPRRAVGGWSVAQQTEELRQLEALATKPPAPAPLPEPVGAPAAAAAAPAADPADRLAAWLLQQADLSDLG